MRRSSFFALLTVSFFSAVASAQTSGGQTNPASPSDQPAAGTPPATTSAPTGRAPAPAAPSGSAAPSAPPVSVDRGSLLEPATGGDAAPAPEPRAQEPKAQEPKAQEPKSQERRADSSIGANPKDIYAEDWWVHSRPIFELHGYLRVRAELFHGFSLGRLDSSQNALWPQPADNTYIPINGTPQSVAFYCSGAGNQFCQDKSQAGANMRFRLNPELHISDNLRIMSQVDMLDNLVLGSTPAGYVSTSSGAKPVSPYYPIGAFSDTQVTPIAGINSFTNSVSVKRAWGEYATPVGQLRFGRMPSHWGLGILENSGDGYDSDWQSTVDRIMFTTGIKSLDLYVSGAWDFPNEGPTSATQASTIGGQPYDLAQLDDVNEYVLMVAHRRDPELAKSDLAHGDAVLNGGVYFMYRDQLLAADSSGAAAPLGTSGADITGSQYYTRRDLQQFIPDLWLQILYRKFRFEMEAAMIAGTIGNLSPGASPKTYKFMQLGLAAQTELKAIEDRLHLQFGFGWASGDAGLVPDTNRTSTLSPTSTGSIYGPRIQNNDVYREFRFHPDYRIDLILNRNILGRVQGEYYFRPSVDYDFTRSTQGQRFGGGAAIIWSRASEAVQAPGHQRDLGIEFDLSLYYQSKDGALNDDPDKMGGFYTMLQYGVLFPLGGLGYLPSEQPPAGETLETSAAHTVRWYLGILF